MTLAYWCYVNYQHYQNITNSREILPTLGNFKNLQACLANIRKNDTNIRLMSPTFKISHQHRFSRLMMLLTDCVVTIISRNVTNILFRQQHPEIVTNIIYEMSWYKMTWYEVHVV